MSTPSQSASEIAAEKEQPIEWQTEILRVTVFGRVSTNSWKEITGSEPDQAVRQTPPNPSFEAGPYHGGRLVVSHQGDRCDIALVPDPSNATYEILHLGDFQRGLDTIIQVVHKSYKSDAIATRLAVGAVMMWPVASQTDGMKLLKSVSGIAPDIPEDAEDILYHVNVPIVVNLQIAGRELKINRLLKWNLGLVQIMNVTVGLGVPTQLVSSSPVSAVRFEMDINTPAELSRQLSHDQIIEGIDILAAQASAIGKVGGFPR